MPIWELVFFFWITYCFYKVLLQSKSVELFSVSGSFPPLPPRRTICIGNELDCEWLTWHMPVLSPFSSGNDVHFYFWINSRRSSTIRKQVIKTLYSHRRFVGVGWLSYDVEFISLPVSGPQYFLVEDLWDQSGLHGQIMNTGTHFKGRCTFTIPCHYTQKAVQNMSEVRNVGSWMLLYLETLLTNCVSSTAVFLALVTSRGVNSVKNKPNKYPKITLIPL